MATIDVEEVSFSYNDKRVLHEVSLHVGAGELLALVGQNGAGKTTLAKHFNGLLKPTAGVVRVNGIDTRQAVLSQLVKEVGYCYQNPDHQIFSATVRDELSYGPRQMGVQAGKIEQRMRHIAVLVGIDQYLNAYPYTLSKGIRQKVAVASVLMSEAKILVVDEPTTGLDWAESVSTMRFLSDLSRRGHTVCVITHDMRIVAEFIPRTVVMRQGSVIADDATRQVFSAVELLASAFVVPPQITRIGHRRGHGSPTWLTVDEGVSGWRD